MRYLTRGWAGGDLDDAECEAASAAYLARLDEIGDRLPPTVLRLAREINLHDAIVEWVHWAPIPKTLEISFVTSSDRHGRGAVLLTYRGALLGVQKVETLRRVARDREACVLYDEVDRNSSGELVHRLLFWPNEELGIDFAELELSVSERTDQRVNLNPYFIESIEDEDEG